MHGVIARLCCGALLASSVWGCAPLTEQELYERSERLNQARDEFLVREEQCESRGGMMQMRVRPLEKPGYLDYRAATCVRR